MSTFQTQHFLFLSKFESENLEKQSKKTKKKRKKTPDVAWKVDWDRIGCFH